MGNKYSDGFLREIKRYCDVQTFDAYTEGEKRIFNAMQGADYVFLLIGSIPHAITDYTKEISDLKPGNDKVQIFDIPAKYDGVIRLHYLYANKN